jgi:saccharopine dehydrogenase-like NADP-dependent oxidoreductase
MTNILLFGAGKSATILIKYLCELTLEENYQLTVVDTDVAGANNKIKGCANAKVEATDVNNEEERKLLVEKSSIVISLLPPSLHFLVAKDCLLFSKNLLTASYIDDGLKQLSSEIKNKGLLFLCEMGLDPGIDHMSAMKLIDEIKEDNGEITSFVSHCGGLVAPESSTNPWHYKISWNPKNVVLAGKAGASFKKNNEAVNFTYNNMYINNPAVNISGLNDLVFYPNRDSLSYEAVYNVYNCHTFIRTTLRHKDFCKGWNFIISWGLTNENNLIDTKSLSYKKFYELVLTQNNIILTKDDWMYAMMESLGLNSNNEINLGSVSYATVLQKALEIFWPLLPNDKDMVVMQHEIGFKLNGIDQKITSSMVLKGENNSHTAMAKTVGLPLGIATKLILKGIIKTKGLTIPTTKEIYLPVLAELKEYGIAFNDTFEIIT